MHEMQLRAAKENLSKVIDQAVSGEPVVITRRGKPEAVVLSWEEYGKLKKGVPNFGWLISHPPEAIDDIPARDQTPPRTMEL